MFTKRGQVTAFIILAVIIVVFGVAIYFFYPEIETTLGFEEQNPNIFIQNCLEDKIKSSIDELSIHGGSINPSFYFTYQNENLEYLCYTSEYYQTCVVQIPFLEKHIESEIKNNIKDDADACFEDLVQSYIQKGYSVDIKKGDINVEVLPKRVVATINHSVTLTKDSTENYKSFNVILNNNIYELIGIASSIIEWETIYGDAETTSYMNYYHDLKVEKKKQSDGTTVYILTDRNTQNKFQFASRSIAWPGG